MGAEVAENIKANDLVDPSYDASCPPVLDFPPDAEVARHGALEALEALEALDELRDHLLGPVGALIDHFIGVSHSHCGCLLCT